MNNYIIFGSGLSTMGYQSLISSGSQLSANRNVSSNNVTSFTSPSNGNYQGAGTGTVACSSSFSAIA